MQNMTAYEKAHADYRKLSGSTEPARRADKVKAAEEVRAIEREAARDGVILSGGKRIGEAPSKRSLQEEYVRRFDDKTRVQIDGNETTLSDYHSKRLLGK